jgi:aryl sulfotransferase
MSGAIWLASYPKSGNTWARFALRSLHGGGEQVGLNDIGRFAIWNVSHALMDKWLGVESNHLTAEEAEALRPDFHAAYFDLPEPRPVKVHDAWTRTADGRPIFDAAFTHAAIYLLRDPRDVAVSWARFMGRSLDRAVAMLADPEADINPDAGRGKSQLRQRLGSWSGHIASWIDESGLDPVVIRYEDMLADPADALRRMAARIGWDASDEAVAGAVEATRFERLAGLERRHGFVERSDKAQAFFRSGKAGGWRDVLSPEQGARIERDQGEMMARFGYL